VQVLKGFLEYCGNVVAFESIFIAESEIEMWKTDKDSNFKAFKSSKILLNFNRIQLYQARKQKFRPNLNPISAQ
jgi:hypothetical protein